LITFEKGDQILTGDNGLVSKFSALFPVMAVENKSLCAIVEDRIFLVYGAPEMLVSYSGSQLVLKNFPVAASKI
jgi:hypothetical protein